MIPSQRHLFDIPSDVTFFNCSYYGPQLKTTSERLIEGSQSKMHPWKMAPKDFFHDAEKVRGLFAQMFGSSAENYAITASASYGLSTAARILESKLSDDDEILILQDEFPSTVYAMKRLAKETGATILTVKEPTDYNWTSSILDNISDKTSVVAVSPCHWKTGASIDLVAIRQACDTAKAILIVDGTQTLGVIPFSVEQIRPDFLVAACYKWLLCPYGFGMFYADPKWHNERPLEETWMVRDNAEDFNNLMNYSDNYMDGAKRFEVSEKSATTILPGVIDAFEQILTWGVENIQSTLKTMTSELANELESLGFTVIPEEFRTPHILGATMPKHAPENLLSLLTEHNIYLSQRGRSIRFAPYLYNDRNDIERLLRILREVLDVSH